MQAMTSPVSATFFEYGTSVVSVNASTDYRLSVSAYPDALYDPVYLEVTVPYDNTSNVFSICRVELVHVGSHMPCVNQSKVNASITYYSMYVYFCLSACLPGYWCRTHTQWTAPFALILDYLLFHFDSDVKVH